MRDRAACLLVAVVACAAPRSDDRAVLPIVNGVPDDGDLGVVGLVTESSVFCTGTLVNERVVLTAAHCVASAEAVLFGPSIDAGTLIAVVDGRVHPDHQPATLEHDVGLLLLAEAAPAGATPWPLHETPFDAGFVGRPIRLVGYGLTENPLDPIGRKRQGTTIVESFGAADFRFGPDPAQTCMGDSGGPAFLDDGGVERLAGIASAGDPACVSYGVAMRVDVYAGAFIRPYLLETAPGAAGLGERCFYTAHCTTGLCLAPPDPPAFSYCSQACADGVSCSPGMECEGGTCRYPTPSPGAIGATCKAGEECVSGLCAAPAPGGAPACSVRCFPENVMPCPPGFLCDVNAGDPSRFACFAEEAAGDGGCGCGAGRIPARPGGVLLLVAAVVAAAHRKRRR